MTEPPAVASAEIPLPEGSPLKLAVSPAGRQRQCLVVAVRGEIEHRGRFDTDSSTSRERFIKKLAAKIGVVRDVLAALIEAKLTSLANQIDEKKPSPTGQSEDEMQSQATLAVNMATDWELWHTPSKEAYATIVVDDHKENWLVKSQTFKRFVARQFFNEQGKAMNSEAGRGHLRLTAPGEVAERSDLLDRCLIMWLPEIPQDRRRTEAELFEVFYKVWPQILGAVRSDRFGQ